MQPTANPTEIAALFSALMVQFSAAPSRGTGTSAFQSSEFADLLAREGITPEILAQLGDLLPEAQATVLEELLAGGNLLPLAADSLPLTSSEANLVAPGTTIDPPLYENSSIGDRIEVDPRGATPTPLVMAETKDSPSIIGLPSDPRNPKRSNPVVENGFSRELRAGTQHAATPADVVPGGEQRPQASVPGVMAVPFAPVIEDLNAGPGAWITAVARRSDRLPDPLTTGEGILRPVSESVERLGVAHSTGPRPGYAELPDLKLPLGGSRWEQGVGERVLWMIGSAVQGASLRITPPHMGPIDIQVMVHNDQANVSFSAHHALVREALESAIPRLREMFSENNLQLVQVDVGQGSNDHPRPQSGTPEQEPGGTEAEGYQTLASEEGTSGASGDAELLYRRSNGLLDDYA